MKFDLFLSSQPKVLKLIHNSFKKNRLVHTYLFEGPRGTAKLEAAYYLACKLLCTGKGDKPCFECEDCKKVMEQTHPSIYYLEPENNVITKEQVEKLEREFSLTPLTSGVRIYIINEIDKANASAANSLLKFFEELEGDKYGVLLTENLQAVIPTIRSRAVVVYFDQLPTNVVRDQLISKGVDSEISSALSIITNSVDESQKLIQEGVIIDLIDVAKKLTFSLAMKDSSPVLVIFANEELIVNNKDKKYHNLFLDLLITLANDKLYYKLNQIDKIIFKDTMGVIGLSLNLTYEEIVSEIELLLSFKERLRYNVNLDLFYTQLIIEMMRYYG